MTKLRVMHLGSKGAGPRMLLDFARAAADHGVAVSLAYFGGNELADDLAGLGLPTHASPAPRRGGLPGMAWRVLSNGWYAITLRRFVRAQGVDAVYAVMDNPLDLLPTLLLRWSGVPVLGSAHDPDLHRGEEHPVIEFLMWLRPQSYSGLMTYSSSVATRVARRSPRPDRVFETVHAAYGMTDVPPPARQAVGTPVRVGFFGRLLRYKGLGRLAAAVRQLRDEGLCIQLAVYGSGNIDHELARALHAVDAEVENRWIEDREIASIVSSCDIIALPYEEASQSGVVGYAMNAAVPVVVTPVGGLTEQVVDAGVGIAADDMTPKAFAQAIRRLCEERGTYAALSARGPVAARKLFGWDRPVRDVLAAVELLRKEPRHRWLA
jgi:glycosyltransferase involved in cell wall biosynthesis